MMNEKEYIHRLDTIPVKFEDLPQKDRFESILAENDLVIKNRLIADLLLDLTESGQIDSKFYLAVSELPGIDNTLRDMSLDLMIFFEEGQESNINKDKILNTLKKLGRSE